MTSVVVGTGYTGLRLLNRLPASEALGLSRSVPTDTGGRVVRRLLLDRTVAALDLPAPFRVVYTVPPATDVDRDRRLERFLTALERPPERVIYLSTTGVYGDHAGDVVTEDTPVTPGSARAGRRVAAEAALNRYGDETGAEITILRVPGIYGPDRLMIDRIRDMAPLIEDAEANPGNRIHVDDLVTACLAALNPELPAGIYNLGDGDTRTSTWFAKEVARQLGWPEPPTISREDAQSVYSQRLLSFLNESRRVDTTRMREVLGVMPRYADAADGIHASLKEMGLVD